MTMYLFPVCPRTAFLLKAGGWIKPSNQSTTYKQTNKQTNKQETTVAKLDIKAAFPTTGIASNEEHTKLCQVLVSFSFLSFGMHAHWCVDGMGMQNMTIIVIDISG